MTATTRNTTNNNPLKAVLIKRDDENDIQISLGIEEGLQHLWKTAIARFGSISLAEKGDVRSALASAMLDKNINPSAVFGLFQEDNNATPTRGGQHDQPLKHMRPRSATNASTNFALWSNRHDVLHTGNRRKQTASDGAVDNDISTTTPGLQNKPTRRQAPQQGHRHHRSSIKLEKLLPPKTPDQTGIIKLTNSKNTLPSLAGKCSSSSKDNRMVHRRAVSLPLSGNDPAAIALPSRDIEGEQPLSSNGSHSVDSHISSLEDQVSAMFNELGLQSPYISSASHTRQQRFHRQYHGMTIQPMSRVDRHVVLVDDDDTSSSVDTDYLQRHTNHPSPRLPLYYHSSIPENRPVDDNRAGCNCNCHYQYHQPPYTSPSLISSTTATIASSPYDQIHSLMKRIEQTNSYVHEIGSKAARMDKMLTELRIQSCGLAESLSISQTRVSTLSQLVANAAIAGNRSQPEATCGIRSPPVSTTGDVADYNHKYSTLADKTREFQRKIQSSRDKKHHQISTVSVPKVSVSSKSKYHSRKRRPVQPISVRVERIDKQWSDLRSLLERLRLDQQPVIDNEEDTNPIAEEIAADGLKLIQKMLKLTLESLDVLPAAVLSH